MLLFMRKVGPGVAPGYWWDGAELVEPQPLEEGTRVGENEVVPRPVTSDELKSLLKIRLSIPSHHPAQLPSPPGARWRRPLAAGAPPQDGVLSTDRRSYMSVPFKMSLGCFSYLVKQNTLQLTNKALLFGHKIYTLQKKRTLSWVMWHWASVYFYTFDSCIGWLMFEQ